METDYTQVTEVANDNVSAEQVERMYTRYHFARQYCNGKDVIELGCGPGQGLGYLAKSARTVIGGDYSDHLISLAQHHYKERIPLVRLDARILPFKDQTFDVAILFEAIYYLKESISFVKECTRILRPGGILLICNANKDLPDFNPSPYSCQYFSPPDFIELLNPFGFQVECFGDCKADYNNPKQRFLSLIKKTMVSLNLMPKTMSGKKLLKRIVFGKLVSLPPELDDENAVCRIPCAIDSDLPDLCHKVIFVAAKKSGPR